MIQGLKPFENTSNWRFAIAIAVTAVVILAVWQFYPSYILPRPWETVQRGISLFERGLIGDVGVSVWIIIRAGLISFVIGSIVSYGLFLSDLKPTVHFIAILRCLPMSAPVVLLLALHFNGDDLKLYTMVFIITVYFVAANVQSNFGISPQMVYHGFTLGMSRWQILWHRVIRGGMFYNIMNFIPNLGMGWSMLTLIEGLSRSSGGIGDVMLQQEKIFSFSGIAALCVLSGSLGFAMWFSLTKANKGMHPHGAAMTQTQGT